MIELADLTPDQIGRGLYAWAKGSYPLEAAVLLLVGHDTWLRHADFVRDCLGWPASHKDGGTLSVWIDWVAAMKYTDACTPGTVLAVACSIGGGEQVDFGSAVNGLDRRSMALILAALSHANGSHQHLHRTYGSGDYDEPLFPWPPTVLSVAGLR